jgi:hypothetical protein
VPRHDPIQGRLERFLVELTRQPQRRRNVIGSASSMVEPIQEPEALLRPRQRQRLCPINPNERRLLRLRAALSSLRHYLGELSQGWLAEEFA